MTFHSDHKLWIYVIADAEVAAFANVTLKYRAGRTKVAAGCWSRFNLDENGKKHFVILS